MTLGELKALIIQFDKDGIPDNFDLVMFNSDMRLETVELDFEICGRDDKNKYCNLHHYCDPVILCRF